MKLKEIMKRPVVSISADYCVSRAAQVMGNSGFGFLPVIDSGRIVGVVTGKDLATRAAAKRISLESALVSGIMSSPPICLDGDADVEDALILMRQQSIRRIVVTEPAGTISGVVSMADLEGSAVDDAIARAAQRYTPRPVALVEREAHCIPGLYLG